MLPKNGKRTTIVFVDMEIMRTPYLSFIKRSAALCLAAGAVSGAFASEITLKKVPAVTVPSKPISESKISSSASFALINYNLSDLHAKARALYVSSGADLKQANNMIDDQTATSYGFSAQDNSPTAVIDLGKPCTMKRLSAIYSAHPGTVDFYVMQSLPGAARNETGENGAKDLKFDSEALTHLNRVGSSADDGTRGTASIDFPATTGRYIMLRWIPAAHFDTSFTVAEVAAFGANQGRLIASNGNFSSETADSKSVADSKDMGDSKDIGDNKDIPAEGPAENAPPGEGPPPGLPNPPPFTFIPEILPTSP